MALYLVQHGISAAKEVDPEKGLSEEGIEQTLSIAQVAAGYGPEIGIVVHSGKKRARQTAEIMHEKLLVQKPLTQVQGIAPLDDVQPFAQTVELGENRMVVGHMPFMERLVSYLTTGSQDIRVYRLQNSGIVCLDASEDENGKLDWFIKWTLNPRIS